MSKIISISGKKQAGKNETAKIIKALIAGYDFKSTENMLELNEHQDTISSENFQWEIKSFAHKVKQVASILTGYPISYFSNKKHIILPKEWQKHVVNITWENVNEHGISNDIIERRIFANEEKAQKCRKEFEDQDANVFTYIPTIREFLQELGTDAIRDYLHPDTWVNALFSEFNHLSNWIISDTRFYNELNRIRREKTSKCFTIYINGDTNRQDRHVSETELDDCREKTFDYIIDNNSSRKQLIKKVKEILRNEYLL